MNEIERAIKFLGYVKGYDIQSANLAIEALREQAERRKGASIACKEKIWHMGLIPCSEQAAFILMATC